MKETKRIRMSDENIASRVKLTLQTFEGRSTEDLMNAIGQHVRNLYESSVAKDEELIQTLLDALVCTHEDRALVVMAAKNAALAAGFKPN